MKRVFLLFLLCINCSLLGQQVLISTVACDVSDEEVVEIKQRLTFQKNFFRKELSDLPDKDILVKVFGNYADFSTYASDCCQLGAVTTAFLNVNKLEIVVFKNKEFIRSLSHEISHALTINSKIDLHFWLSEGLSDVMSSYKPNSEEGFVEERMYFGKDLRLNEKSTKRLTRFLSISAEEWSSLSTYNSYGVSWALVNYLYKEDRLLLREIIQAVENDQNAEEVISKKYKKGLKGFFQLVRAYYAN